MAPLAAISSHGLQGHCCCTLGWYGQLEHASLAGNPCGASLFSRAADWRRYICLSWVWRPQPGNLTTVCPVVHFASVKSVGWGLLQFDCHCSFHQVFGDSSLWPHCSHRFAPMSSAVGAAEPMDAMGLYGVFALTFAVCSCLLPFALLLAYSCCSRACLAAGIAFRCASHLGEAQSHRQMRKPFGLTCQIVVRSAWSQGLGLSVSCVRFGVGLGHPTWDCPMRVAAV
jgi:hypothetical protein